MQWLPRGAGARKPAATGTHSALCLIRSDSSAKVHTRQCGSSPRSGREPGDLSAKLPLGGTMQSQLGSGQVLPLPTLWLSGLGEPTRRSPSTVSTKSPLSGPSGGHGRGGREGGSQELEVDSSYQPLYCPY